MLNEIFKSICLYNFVESPIKHNPFKSLSYGMKKKDPVLIHRRENRRQMKKSYAIYTMKSYNDAKELDIANPIKLGLVSNISVFTMRYLMIRMMLIIMRNKCLTCKKELV
jgi:hypothetical protein